MLSTVITRANESLFLNLSVQSPRTSPPQITYVPTHMSPVPMIQLSLCIEVILRLLPASESFLLFVQSSRKP